MNRQWQSCVRYGIISVHAHTLTHTHRSTHTHIEESFFLEWSQLHFSFMFYFNCFTFWLYVIVVLKYTAVFTATKLHQW